MPRHVAPPSPIREIENLWVPMPDSVRLAKVWLPDDAEERPVPVLLGEYLPYRKRDGTRGRDAKTHRYVAGHGHGYACVRLDIRGCGGQRRRDLRRVHAAGAGGRRRGHRVAGRATLVRRPGGDDRHLLGRLQRAANCCLATAGAEDDHYGRLDGRPLRDGHPLGRRLPVEGQLRLVGETGGTAQGC